LIDGKWFEKKYKDGENTFVEISKEKVDKKLKILKEITDKLTEKLDKEAVLMEALSNLDIEYLEMLHNNLYNSKRTYKVETRKHHCVDMKVGKLIVPIVPSYS
jgi:hypothetical protein